VVQHFGAETRRISMYIGGGVILVILIILLVLFFARRGAV
jgi:hypothetical protein